MKQGYFQIISFITLLLMTGCAQHDASYPQNNNNDNNNSNNKEDHHHIISRFELNASDNSPENMISEPGVKDSFQYYRPTDDDIIKQSIIPANGQLKISRQTKEDASYFRKPTFHREPALFKPGRTSPEVFFTAIFDNDIFDYTDYYYTNGIGFELYHPAISASPVSRVLPGLKNSMNYYGLTLVQNMYTPLKLEELTVRIGDRPFAAYLTIGHQRISLSAYRHRRLQSEFIIGTIGPASLGNQAQDLIHSNTPVGWVNQVKNDFVVNYSIRFDQGVYSGNGIELAVFAGGQGGTLYDNITAGFFFQMGRANDRYGSVFQTTEHEKPYRKRVRYYFSLDIKNKLVVYDATLQGGMFNKESNYKLDGNQVSHYVFTGTASVGLGLGRYSLEAEQVFLTPEFDGGRKHLWFRIKNIIRIN
jgi:lipid A 3-O-deacylase